MKKLLHLIIYIPLLLLTTCDVHEWPELPESVAFNLRLKYHTEMTEWFFRYENNKQPIEEGTGITYDNVLNKGKIRYIVRVFPATKHRATRTHTLEYVYIKDLSEGYDHDVTLELAPGVYDIMVWSDLVKDEHTSYSYNADDFNKVLVNDSYVGSTNYSDAFRGFRNVVLNAEYYAHAPEDIVIDMERAVGKFELIATDLKEFIDKELEFLAKEAATRGDVPPTRVETDNYKVVIKYGSLPNEFYIPGNEPVEVKTGVSFESKIDVLSEEEASLAFDYVFSRATGMKVDLQVELYDNKGRELARTEPLMVSLQPDRHTILKGPFMMQQASGGIQIHPEFAGNLNVTVGDDGSTKIERDDYESSK